MHLSELPPQLELRKDQPLPADKDFRTQEWWQIYIDNYDEARSGKQVPFPEETMGMPSEWSLRLRSFGEKLGVVFTNDADKH